jgi:hypothetical protein
MGAWQLRQFLSPGAPKVVSVSSSACWNSGLSMARAWAELLHASRMARWHRPQNSALLAGSSSRAKPVAAVVTMRTTHASRIFV